MDEYTAKEEVIRAGRLLTEKGLVARTWGNVSCRIDEKSFAITPSGIGYERLTPELIVKVDTETITWEGDIAPSSEKGIHAAIYADPDVGFIIHTHQLYATCLSVAGFNDLSVSAEEIDKLGGPVKFAAYGPPGTKKLKDNVVISLKSGGRTVLMERHGALIIGKDVSETFDRAVLLEDICKKAAPQVTIFEGQAETFSSRTSGENFDFAGDNNTKEIHHAIYTAFPAINNILQFTSDSVSESIEISKKTIPAVLDDFAQMAGVDAKLVDPSPAQVVRGLKGRNVVFVRGIGAFVCAGNKSDAEALTVLTEKNALAIIGAKRYGRVKPIDFIGRHLMRYVYLNKYSNKK